MSPNPRGNADVLLTGSASQRVKVFYAHFQIKLFLAGGEQAVFSGSNDDLETTGYKKSRFTNVTISSPVEALASGSFRWALISTEMKKILIY